MTNTLVLYSGDVYSPWLVIAFCPAFWPLIEHNYNWSRDHVITCWLAFTNTTSDIALWRFFKTNYLAYWWWFRYSTVLVRILDFHQMAWNVICNSHLTFLYRKSTVLWVLVFEFVSVSPEKLHHHRVLIIKIRPILFKVSSSNHVQYSRLFPLHICADARVDFISFIF